MTSFKPNLAGIQELAVGGEMRSVVRDVAEKAKVIAEGLAQDFRITGEYAGSFEVSEETDTLAGHARAAAVLTNHAGYAAAVEFGNEHVDHPHRVLGRTLDALGG